MDHSPGRFLLPLHSWGKQPIKKRGKGGVSPGPQTVASPPLAEPHPDSGSKSISKGIECLCTTLRMATTKQICLGLLISERNMRRHRVWIPERPWLKFQPEKTVSLDWILKLPLETRPIPTRESRSNSEFSLHQSGWLYEDWGKTDIFFPEGSNLEGPIFAKPLLYHAEFPPTGPPETPRERDISTWQLAWCNRSIFHLGVTLIEVWYWKPLSDLQAELQKCSRGDAVLSEFDLAQRLAWGLVTAAGYSYGMAVKLCIVGLEHSDTRLEDCP